jgi:outer membrane protein assembly factor BamB
MLIRSAGIVLSGLWIGFATAGENWPQWRGPRLDGASDSTGLPTTWSTTENVVWKAPLPSWGGATPIVWGDRVFVVSPSKQSDSDEATFGRKLPRGGRSNPGGSELLLVCIDKGTGKQRWQQKLGEGNSLYGKQNMASPSPVTDGKHVWALTGTGELVALTVEGKEAWRVHLQKEYGEFGLVWGYASSPLLYNGNVIVEVLHGATNQAQGYLVSFDGASGKVLWKVDRETDATRECPDAYTTPTISPVNGRTDLVISGADYVTGHDPATGKERWRAGGLNPEKRGNYRVCGSPVVVGEMIFATSRNRPILALRAGGDGDVSESHLVWRYDGKKGPDVPTPVCDGERYYMIDDRGYATCLDRATGEVIWGPERTAQGTYSASPLLADGKLYVTNENGVTTVLKAGAQFEVLATNDLDDAYTISSIAVSGKQLFIRTSEFLYCIGLGR